MYITSSTFLIILKKLCATLITALSIGAKERVFIWHKRWLNSDKKLDNGYYSPIEWMELHRWYNGWCACLESCRGMVGAQVWSIERLWNRYLLESASPLSTQLSEVRSKTGWVRMGIMCPSETTCFPADLFFQGTSAIKIQLSMLV